MGARATRTSAFKDNAERKSEGEIFFSFRAGGPALGREFSLRVLGCVFSSRQLALRPGVCFFCRVFLILALHLFFPASRVHICSSFVRRSMVQNVGSQSCRQKQQKQNTHTHAHTRARAHTHTHIHTHHESTDTHTHTHTSDTRIACKVGKRFAS